LDTFGDGVTALCSFGCGTELSFDTITVDRYPIPGCKGGTYQRGNIRPACARENSADGATAKKRKTMVEVPDLRGDLVGVGDTIAYAATDGRSSGLRLGKVIEVIESRVTYSVWDKDKEFGRKQPTKLRVEVDYSTDYGTPVKPVLIAAGLKRFVKVGT
jgi:hypothetical protein